MRLPARILFFLLLLPMAASGGAPASSADACERALQAGDHAQAVRHAEAALGAAPGSRDALLCLGRAQGERGNHAAALAALQKAEQLSSQPFDRMVAITLLGNEHKAAGEFAQAIDAYQRSLSIALAEKSIRFELINLNLIGEALDGQGDHAAALARYQQGLKLAANDNERADSQARVAAAHSLLGQHDQAIEHQLKAMLYEERSGDLDHYANASVELGRICLAAKQYAEAEKWLGKFLGTIAGTGDSYWQARARMLLGQAKAGKGAAAEATAEFAQARALARKIGATQLLQEIEQAESAAESL